MLTGTLAGCAPKPVEATPAAAAEKEDASGEAGGAGTQAAQDTADLPVLKVAVMPFLNSIPIKYMIDQGLDTKNGFKIETVYFANGGAMNEALAEDRNPLLPRLRAITHPIPMYTVTLSIPEQSEAETCAAPAGDNQPEGI